MVRQFDHSRPRRAACLGLLAPTALHVISHRTARSAKSQRCLQVLRRFDLKDKVTMGRGEKQSVGSNLKWTPDQADKQQLPPAGVLAQQARDEMAAGLRRRPKVRVDGKSMRPRQLKTHEWNLALVERRQARIEAAWRERLRANERFLPRELQAGQRAALEAQMEAKSEGEIVAAKRAARQARRRLQQPPTKQRTSHVQHAV